MTEQRNIDQAVEACLTAHEAIKRHGTPEMQATMRILLFQIGEEIARRHAETKNTRDGGNT